MVNFDQVKTITILIGWRHPDLKWRHNNVIMASCDDDVITGIGILENGRWKVLNEVTEEMKKYLWFLIFVRFTAQYFLYIRPFFFFTDFSHDSSFMSHKVIKCFLEFYFRWLEISVNEIGKAVKNWLIFNHLN